MMMVDCSFARLPSSGQAERPSTVKGGRSSRLALNSKVS